MSKVLVDSIVAVEELSLNFRVLLWTTGDQVRGWGRSTGKLDDLLKDFEQRGIDLRILNMDLDTSSPSGKLIFRIVSALAENERDLISERTKSALDAKRRRGERVGGRKPTHTPEQVARAMQMLDSSDMTGQEVAGAVGMSRSRMYALVARARAEQRFAGK